MGFFDENEDQIPALSNSPILDLVEYENRFVDKFNDTNLLETKYLAEEFGLAFNKKTRRADIYSYDGQQIVICPEPLSFLKEFDDVSDNAAQADVLFREKIASFQSIHLNRAPELKGYKEVGTRMWMNKTLTGINLRPGNKDDDLDNFSPVRMCDDNVHGLIAGRTGSGKSVFINALILSLLTEYPPWELNIYLADFKKVELSRYMNNADAKNNMTAFTPHINACAATSEIRYVISLIRYLVDCMNARQEFFSRIGVTKIQEFRTRYDVVLPRVLLIVDEFQQMFTEATSREAEEIQNMLNSITKLGRATGFHLVFASQEMSGTLRGNTLANFKIRMALPCTPQVSSDILGNSRAVSLERGYVLVNTESGDEKYNMLYHVPFIETDKKDSDEDDQKSPFYQFLDEMKLAASHYDLRYKTSAQKFYREELQEKESDYLKDLESIAEQKNALVAQNHTLFDAVVLGKTVLYSSMRNDKVSFYIEKGRNKGVMIATPNPDDAARIRKMLAENLLRSNIPTCHLGVELNNFVYERYKMGEEIKRYPLHQYKTCEVDSAPVVFQQMVAMRQAAARYMESIDLDSLLLKQQKKLVEMMQDDKLAAQSRQIYQRKEQLRSQLQRIEAELAQKKRMIPVGSMNVPALKFLDLCSKGFKLKDSPANFHELAQYPKIKDALKESTTVAEDCKKLIAQINPLADASLENKTDNQQVAILQYKFLRISLRYLVSRYEDKPLDQKVNDLVLAVLTSCYEPVALDIERHRQQCRKMQEESEIEISLREEKKECQRELEALEQDVDPLQEASDELKRIVNGFLTQVWETALAASGTRYTKNTAPKFPVATFRFEQNTIHWQLEGGTVNDIVRYCAQDVLRVYIAVGLGERFNPAMFEKIVFWFNGLDEIEKLPSNMIEAIRNSINQNILTVAIITSELKDVMIRKAFDYAFVTGNVEKFYTMFDIKYTKQPIDSIVVNFGIRSKGFDIPFKMYKSQLAEIKSPSFIDGLLNRE